VKQAGIGGQSGNPAAENNREALPHQEAISGVGGRARVVPGWRAVELDQRALAAAIVHVIEECAVSLGHVGRLQDVEIGRIFHSSGGAQGRLVEVHDAGIERLPRIQLAVETTNDFLVGPRLTEGLTAGERLRSSDLDPRDPGLSG
jgi:hypothetical protein